MSLVSACAGRPPADAPLRTVAFDNKYGAATTLAIHVRVDDGREQSLTATCDPMTCSFQLPLTNAKHELTLTVEQDGQRSEPTLVTVDTGALP